MTHESNRAVAQTYDPMCRECKGSGERDSGGTHPWGEPAMLPCDCNRAAPVPASTGREPESITTWQQRRALGDSTEGAMLREIRDLRAALTANIGIPASVAARELDADAERLALPEAQYRIAPGIEPPCLYHADEVRAIVMADRRARATAESAPRTFEQWWTEPTPTTAAPYTFMDERSARAAWVASRNATESAPASAAPDEQQEQPSVMPPFAAPASQHHADPEVERGLSDPLYSKAVMIVSSNNRASISLVQRHLAIGYNRAARLLEAMEACKVVSAEGPTGARTVIAPSNSPVGAKEQDK